MNKKLVCKKSILTSALLSLLISGTAFAKAHDNDDVEVQMYEHKMQHRHQRMKNHMRHAFAHLDLSDEQHSAIKALKESTKETAKTRRGLMKQLRKQMHGLMKAETIDESAIRSLSVQIAEVKAEQMITHANFRQQAVAVLNDEQKAKLETMKAKRIQRMKEWHEEE